MADEQDKNQPQNGGESTSKPTIQLTGDFDTDARAVAQGYKPKDIDDNTWGALWQGVITQESSGDSSTGESTYGKLPKGKRAFGIAQILPSTAKQMGYSEEEVKTDPLKNFAAGVKYLATNWNELGKDPRVASPDHRALLTIASYHAGLGNVKKDLDKNGDGVPDVDDGGINTRDYTFRIADRVRSILGSHTQAGVPSSTDSQSTLPDKAAQEQSGEATPEKVAQPPLNAAGDTMTMETEAANTFDKNAPSGAAVIRQPDPSKVDSNGRVKPLSMEEEAVERHKNVLEALDLKTPDNHPHKYAGNSTVMIPFIPGQRVSADMLSDAVTDSLTQVQGTGAKFRAATGENPGKFQDDITDKWFEDQVRAGNMQYIPKDEAHPEAGGYLKTNIPVQNYVKNRIDAFAKGGVEEVKKSTASMDQEVAQYQRLEAEEQYGQQIARLKDAAENEKDPEEKRKLTERATLLQQELDTKYPVSQWSELWRGIKKGAAEGMYEYERTGLNVKDIGEAVVNKAVMDTKEYRKWQKEADNRDRQVDELVGKLASETPEVRTFLGRTIEGATKEIMYMPIYTASGAVLGPSGLVYTQALRNANRPMKDMVKEMAAALIEVPFGSLGKAIVEKGGYGAVRSKLIEMGFGGLGETAGDAVTDFAMGKKFDMEQALANFIIGGAFELGHSGEHEGHEQHPSMTQPTNIELRSPIAVTQDENGNPRYQAVVKVGDEAGLVELPPQHPFVIKYAEEANAGKLPFMGVTKEQFDQALSEFNQGSAPKLPKLTAEQTKAFLNKETWGAQSDSQNKSGLPSEERGRKEPVQAESVGRTGEEAAGNGGVVQEEQKQTSAKQEVTASKPAQEDSNKTTRKYKDEDHALDTDLAKQWDVAKAEYDEQRARNRRENEGRLDPRNSRVIAAGHRFTEIRQAIISEQKHRDSQAAASAAQPVSQRSQQTPEERVKALSPEEQEHVQNALDKLGVDTEEDVRKVIYDANRQHQKKISETQRSDFKEKAQKLASLTADEQRAIAKVINSNFVAPTKQSEVADGESYNEHVSRMSSEEFDKHPQLRANEAELHDFFDKAKKGEVTTSETAEERAAAKKASEEFQKKQTSIREGTKKVKVSGTEITLPNDLAAQWEQTELDEKTKLGKLGGLSLDEQTKARRDITKAKKDAQKRILNEYRAREEDQFERGYLKNSNRPVVIVGKEGSTGQNVRIRMAGETETRVVGRDEIETRKERAIKAEKKPSLPVSIRVKNALGGFKADEVKSTAKGGVVYITEAVRNRMENALGYEIPDGFTFKRAGVLVEAKKLREAGLDKLAKQVESVANEHGGVPVVSVNNENAGLYSAHERIHQVANAKELNNSTVERLFAEDGNIHKLVTEATASGHELGTYNPRDIIQEVLAYGLTGDHESLGVSPDTLYDATLDTIQAYINEFPNEEIDQIAERALVNFDNIKKEAERKTRNEQGNKTALPKSGSKQEVQIGRQSAQARAERASEESVGKSVPADEGTKRGAEAEVNSTGIKAEEKPLKQSELTFSTVKDIIRKTRQREGEKASRGEVAALKKMNISDNIFAKGMSTMPVEALAEEVSNMGGDPESLKNDKDLMVRWLTREIGKQAEEITGKGTAVDAEAKKAEFNELSKKPTPEQIKESALNKLNMSEKKALDLMGTLVESERESGNPYLSTEDRQRYNDAWDKVFDAELTDGELNRLRGMYQNQAGNAAVSKGQINKLAQHAADVMLQREKVRTLASNPEAVQGIADQLGIALPFEDATENARHVLNVASALSKLDTTSVAEARRKVQTALADVKIGDNLTNIKKSVKAAGDVRLSALTGEEIQSLREATTEATGRGGSAQRSPEQRQAAAQKAAETRTATKQAAETKLAEAPNALRAAREQAAAQGVKAEEVKANEKPNKKLDDLRARIARLDPTLTKAEIQEYLDATKKQDRNSPYEVFAQSSAEAMLRSGAVIEGLPKPAQPETTKPKAAAKGLPVDERLAGIAKEYAAKQGRDYNVGTNYDYKPENYNKIADLMQNLPHDPSNVEVQKAYRALAKETVDQYKYLESKGVKFEPWTSEGQPYANSNEMRDDVRNNNHLWFFLGGDMPNDHPMKSNSGIFIGDYELSINDVFRAVHDFFGHAVSGAQFGPRGEFNATDSHARMYSREALPALLGETVWQNAWVNQGPHIRRADGSIPVKGDPDFIPAAERPYAEQKAMNITPEHVDLWQDTYKESPILPRKDVKEKKQGTVAKDEDEEISNKQRIADAKRKPARQLVKADVQAIVESGKFAMLSGNTDSNAASPRGRVKTEALRRELEKMGYQVLTAEGVYAPAGGEETAEPSLFVVLNDKQDVANLLRLGSRYKQAQVFIGDEGKYRAPFTRNMDFGTKGTETYSKANNVMFGKDAEAQDGKSRIKTSNGTLTFSVPDAFSKVRNQNKAEVELMNTFEKAYKKSFEGRATMTSADLLNSLKEERAKGNRKDMLTLDTGKVLQQATEEFMGGIPDPTKMSSEEYDAVRTRRAVRDGLSFVKDFRKGKSDSASGESWYSDSIRRMHETTGQAFPEINSIPQLRALYDLTLAVSSQGNKVQDNYNYATNIWRRVVEEFGLGVDGGDVFPVKQKEAKVYQLPKSQGGGTVSRDNYGRFGPQLEKFNNLSKGYRPVSTPLELKKLKAAGAEIIESKAFKGVNGAQQFFVKDSQLVAHIEKYGHIGGVFEYLLSPGSTATEPYKATEVLGPKIGAFFLNIAGFSQLVTVDMWAARWFYRINGGLVNETNNELQDTPFSKGDGDIIRGSMQAIASKWNETHKSKLAPADVQAILWYGEKDLWHQAGAEDTGQVDFAMAANNTIPDTVVDVDGVRKAREQAVKNFADTAPDQGPMASKIGTVEASKENENFFVRQMTMPARLGLAKATRKQTMNRNLLSYDANEWNTLAERAKGEPLSLSESNDLYALLTQGYRATTKDQHDAAISGLSDFVDKLSVQSLPEFLLTLRRAGLLSGVRTTGRNMMSNAVFALMEEGRRGVSAPVDMLMSLATKNDRTVQGISPMGVLYAARQGFTEGAKAFYDTLVKGNTGATFETFNVGYDPKSGYKWLDNSVGLFAKYIFRFQGAQDALFRTYAYHRALYEVGALAQKNTGRLIQDVLTNPSIEESDLAWRVAESMVFQEDNAINTTYQRIKSKSPEPVKWLLDYQLPFIKTGSNIFLRTMDYLGIGGVYRAASAVDKEAVNFVKKGEWGKLKNKMWDAIDDDVTRNTIATAFGRGAVGLGIAYIGYRLAAAGLLTGMDDDDEKERNRRIAQGSGAGHLKVGDTWHDIRSLSPIGTLLISGASTYRAETKKLNDESKRVDNYIAIMSSLVSDGLPLARTANDYLNPKSGQSIAQRALGVDSLVPSLVNEIAATQDTVQRDQKGETFGQRIKNSVEAKLPKTPLNPNFNRQSLPVKEDVFGRALPQPNGFNPLNSKKDTSNAVTKEAADVGWSMSAPKQDTKKKESLADFRKRKADIQEMIGRAFETAIKDPDYPKTAPAEDRKQILDSLASISRRAVKEGDKMDDAELKDIVKTVLEKRKDMDEVESDNEMDAKEKKKAKSKIGRRYSKSLKLENDNE